MVKMAKVGTPEWANAAERGEWAFMAKMFRECQDHLPHKLSGVGVAIGIADARAKSGWREFETQVETPTS